MIGLDTNVVVRYITHDDPDQTTTAVSLMNSLTPEAPGFLCLIVVAELVWVLEVAYRFRKTEIVQVIETLLRSKELVLERAEIVAQGLRKFATGNADFADCLIERLGHAAECPYTVTFDRNASAGAGMKLLK